MTSAEHLADFLSRHQIAGIRRAPFQYSPHLVSPPRYGISSTAEQIAEEVLSVEEFRALQLGTWLGTTDGQVIAQAVEMATPPIYRPDVEVLISGLRLAAKMQQQQGQRTAGLLVVGTIAFAGLLAFVAGA